MGFGNRFGICAPALLGACAAFASPALAQCGQGNGQADGQGKTVALVLSGGGALAASQIGALKVIRDLGVPIHCVVGNSMGAVVGALFVAGHEPDDLQRIFIDYEDWNRNSFGANAYKDLSYRSKEEQHDFFAGAVVGVDGGKITLPPGLTSLRGMRSYLREQLKALPPDGKFDDFPIQFRAVATNLSTGLPAVLKDGDVVDATLASMAVPGLYPAQKIGGEWYVDGGMSNQLPVDVAKCLNKTPEKIPGTTATIVVDAACIGADIVIAIDTTIEPVLDKNRQPSADQTAMQLVNLKVYDNWEVQKAYLAAGPDNLHIQPAVGAFTTFDFSKKTLRALYNAGFEAANTEAVRARLEQIKRVARPASRKVVRPDDAIRIASVVIENTSGIKNSVIEDRLGIEAGDSITRKDINNGLADINALGVFEDVDYQIKPPAGGAGDPVLQIDTTANPLGKNLLQLGARLSTSLEGEATYQILARYTRRPMTSYGGRLSATLGLGTDNVLDIDYVHPLGWGARTFVEAGLGLASRRVPVALGDLQLAQRIDKTAEISAALGYEFGQWGAASAGVFATALQSDIKIGSDVGIGAQTGNYTGFTGRFAFDRFDSPSFPTSGFMGDLRLSQYYVSTSGGDGTDGLRSETAVAAASKVGPVGLFLRFDGGNIDQRSEGLPIFQLGGFKRLSGFLDNSVPATRYGLLRMEAFMKSDDEGLPIYFGGTFEIARFDVGFLNLDLGDDVTAGSIYGAIDTPLGPAYLAYGMGEGGREALYVYFGRAF